MLAPWRRSLKLSLTLVGVTVTATALLLAAYLFASGAAPLTSPGTTTAAAADDSSDAPAGISIRHPLFGFNLLPGATRRLFATVGHGKVSWTVSSGDAVLSAAQGPWVDVVMPGKGSTCSITGDQGHYTVVSATHTTVVATSVEDPSKTASVVMNVCDPVVELSVVPFYRTLYANQVADVQSLLLGAVDGNVHWAITEQPKNGDGVIGDADLRDTVFHASAPGRYRLTATSDKDATKTASAILYVTGHPMPYPVTPNGTEPVDCTVDPEMTGTVYEVGPSQPLKTLAEVPFPTMAPGSTVRLHNEDTTGNHPTEYHEYVQIRMPATAEQPFRMCGVPDTAGHLPVIDGDHATGRADSSQYTGGLGIVSLFNSGYWSWYPNYHSAAYVAVEGLALRNATAQYKYTTPDGKAGTWNEGAACMRVYQVHQAAFVGNEYVNCGTGVFSAMNGNGGWGNSSFNILWEGSHIHDNGTPHSYLSHQLYLQAWGEVVQFNRIDDYKKDAGGSNLKSRSIQLIIRSNYFGKGAARQLDLVDVQDAPAYMSFNGLLNLGKISAADLFHGKESYPPDRLAAMQEAFHSDSVYGNIFENLFATTPIHYSRDHEFDEQDREGTLYWYNNTFRELDCPQCDATFTVFDTASGGDNIFAQTEFPKVDLYNSIFWLDHPGRPAFQWNDYVAFIGVAGNNLVTAGLGTNRLSGGVGSGWNTRPRATAYQHADDLGSHVKGFDPANLLTVSSMPFDGRTWLLGNPVAAVNTIPTAMCELPTRFAYLPELSYIVPRSDHLNLGATDTAAQTAELLGKPIGSAPGRTSIHHSACQGSVRDATTQ